MSGLSARSEVPPAAGRWTFMAAKPPDRPLGPVPFEPDTLLPAQWHQVHSRVVADPCARLYLAVLEDAVESLRRYRIDQSAKAKAIRQDIIDWLRDPDGNEAVYTVTFRTVVDVVFGDYADAESLGRAILKAYPHWNCHQISLRRLARTRIE